MNDTGNSSDTRNAVPSLTPQRIARQLSDGGYAVHGGLFADEAGVAWLLGCSARTLRRWRTEGIGPQPLMTTRWVYAIDDLCAWLASRTASQLAGQDRPQADR